MSISACTHPRTAPEPSPEDAARSAGQAHFLARGGKPWPKAEQQTKDAGPQGLIWRAAGTAKGVIVCLHGVQTHAAWFGPLAQNLNRQGWTVIAPDRRGSGVNSAAPFVRGHASGEEQLLDDLVTHMNDARGEAGEDRPVLLLGTSWGSNLATAYVAAGQGPKPKGLIQLVPATEVRPPFSPGLGKKILLGLTNMILPKRRTGLLFGPQHYLAGLDQEALHNADKPLPRGNRNAAEPAMPGQEEANAELAAVLKKDARLALLQRPTVRTLATGQKLAKRWQKSPPVLPVLIITADGDQLMNNKAARDAFGDPVRPQSVSVPAGHGAQITQAEKIAAAIADWVPAHVK